MTYHGFGRVIKGVGGLFTVRVFDGESRLHTEPYVAMPLDGQTVFARGSSEAQKGCKHKPTHQTSYFTRLTSLGKQDAPMEFPPAQSR